MHFPGVALVTGAGSGIGRATAKLFAKDGCSRIVIADLSADALEETKKQILAQQSKVNVLAVQCDVTSEPSIQHLIGTAVSTFTRIDYACNVAGICLPGPTMNFPVSSFDATLAVNARGVWLCQKLELSQMLTQEPLQAEDSAFPQRGAIVNVASMAALRGYEGLSAYCASKSAVIGMTRSDGLAFASRGVRVNAVAPGVIATPMAVGVGGEGERKVDVELLTRDMAMGRMGRAKEVGEALVWLCSGRASFVTATCLAVNGGMIGA